MADYPCVHFRVEMSARVHAHSPSIGCVPCRSGTSAMAGSLHPARTMSVCAGDVDADFICARLNSGALFGGALSPNSFIGRTLLCCVCASHACSFNSLRSCCNRPSDRMRTGSTGCSSEPASKRDDER